VSHHIIGRSRSQATFFPEVLDDFVSTENPVRVIDVFVDELDLSELDLSELDLSELDLSELDLSELGFNGVVPKDTGAPIITLRCCLSYTSTDI